MPTIGIIGGSGLEKLSLLEHREARLVHTPFGDPSDVLSIGTIGGISCVILPRHGAAHHLAPSIVNYRANIWAMKERGVTHLLAPTACGSLREDIKPGQLIFIDQFIDRTTRRIQSFHDSSTPLPRSDSGQVGAGGNHVCHIPMAEPFCPKLRALLTASATVLDIPHHARGTIVTIEGPRFSTRAESHLFRNWNADVINMTTVPEAVLAREAGMCYQPIAMATDYDCWRASEESVTIDRVLAVMKENAERVTKLILDVIGKIQYTECSCREAIKTAML